MRLPIALAAVALGGVAFAQNPRDSFPIEPGAGTFTPAVATDADNSVVVITDSGDVRVSTSDGRGTAWSTPTSITSGIATFTSTNNSNERSVVMRGSNVYVVWQDNRNDDGVSPAENDLFLAVSTDGGATFGPEVVVPKSVAPGTGALRNFRVRVTFDVGKKADSTGDTLYILQSVDVTGSDPQEQLWLAATNDRGTSFTLSQVTQGVAGDVDEIGFDAIGSEVYVAWVDDRAGTGFDDLYFQRSLDSGVTWELTDMSIDGTGAGLGDVADNVDVVAIQAGLKDAEFGVIGNKVAVAWAEEDSGTGNEILHLTVSNDGGASFGPVRDIGNYTPVTDDVDGVDMDGAPDGTLYITWEDNRGGSDEVYVASTIDDGATFTENKVSIAANAAFPQVVVATDFNNLGQALVSWTEDVGADDEAYAAITTDGGTTWDAGVRLSPVGTDNDFTRVRYNPLYNNFLAVWEQEDSLSGADETYVGGLRPQTIVANGLDLVSGSVSFDLSNFPLDDTDGYAAVALNPGLLPLPVDGRITGLANDPILALSLSLPAIPLVGGDGSSIPVGVTPPAGVSFTFIGVSIQMSGGVIWGELSDSQTVTIM